MTNSIPAEYKGLSGVLTMGESYKKSLGYGMEPSGYTFGSVLWLVPCHFHPYNGDMPIDLGGIPRGVLWHDLRVSEGEGIPVDTHMLAPNVQGYS